MNHKEFNELFATQMERDRELLGFSQSAMAKSLGISTSAYKRIISGDVDKIDIYLSYKMYKLTHKFAYEMVGYSDQFVDTITMLKALKSEELLIVNDLCKMLTLSRQYSERHLELMEAYVKLPDAEQKAVDRILKVKENENRKTKQRIIPNKTTV